MKPTTFQRNLMYGIASASPSRTLEPMPRHHSRVGAAVAGIFAGAVLLGAIVLLLA